ncbi:MAG: hypothetical protein AB2L20_08045 [Mangrovibacterium sp.]
MEFHTALKNQPPAYEKAWYTSDFLTSNGESEQYDVYYDKVSYLDANIDYYLSKKIVLYASANNLLNEIQKTYQWKPEYTYSSLENGAHPGRGEVQYLLNQFRSANPNRLALLKK